MGRIERKLREAGALITDPKRHCRDASARDVDGFGCAAKDESAVAWCPSGALRRVGGTVNAQMFLLEVAIRRFGHSVIYVNDTLCMGAELMSEAIEAAEALGV